MTGKSDAKFDGSISDMKEGGMPEYKLLVINEENEDELLSKNDKRKK